MNGPDLPEIPESPPVLFVLSSPSATGKDTVRDLLVTWGFPAHFTVNATDRAMRPGEVDGRDYRFVTTEEFQELIEEGLLIEHAVVYGQHKGVPRDQILDPLQAGRDVIARVDVQGAASLRELVPDCVLIFLAPPSLEEAQRRLEERATDSDGDRQIRIDTAPAEMDASAGFDHIVVNETGNPEAAALRIVEIIAAEKKRRAGRS